MEKPNMRKFASLGVILVLMFSIFLAGCSSGPSQEEYQLALNEAESLKQEVLDANGRLGDVVEELRSQVDTLTGEVETTKAENEQLKAEQLVVMDTGEVVLVETGEVVVTETGEVVNENGDVVEEVVETDLSGYVVDDIGLEGNFAERLDSDDFVKLSYSEVKFDGDKYDVEEVLVLSSDLKPVTNIEDKGGEVFLEVADEGAVEYRLEFIDAVDFEDNCDDEICKNEFVVDFKGKPVSIVDYVYDEDGGKVFMTTGLEASVKEGEVVSVEIEGTLYEVQSVYVDSDSAKFIVNGEATGKLAVGNSYKLADEMEILLTETLYQSYAGGVHSAEFKLGSDVSLEVSTGDEYEEDDRYEWIVEGSEEDGLETLGLKLVETYDDEDDVFAIGEGFSLPGDYLSFTFDSVKNMDLKDLELEIDSDELELKFDGRVEVDDKRVDDGKITFELGVEGFVYEYEYKGEKFKDNEDLSEIVLSYGDRELNLDLVEMDEEIYAITIYEEEPEDGAWFGFVFGSEAQFTGAFGVAEPMNDDDDYRLLNGDLLYKSDVNNEDDRERTVKVGLVSDEEVECVLRVV